MLVTVLGIVMLTSCVHSRNAEVPIAVTLSGIVTVVSAEQPKNAPAEMFATPLSITTVFTLLSVHVPLVIAPVPLMMSLPASSSVQLTPVPQVPLVSARASRSIAGASTSSIASVNKKLPSLFFISIASLSKSLACRKVIAFGDPKSVRGRPLTNDFLTRCTLPKEARPVGDFAKLVKFLRNWFG